MGPELQVNINNVAQSYQRDNFGQLIARLMARLFVYTGLVFQILSRRDVRNLLFSHASVSMCGHERTGNIIFF